ncbi:MAG: glutaminyl-peptide cyclotransferase [Flavobacteriaceae bacterium]|nr:glutaminyl-peptide cyclotransferase [Flavobacteriaceae bacterium]
MNKIISLVTLLLVFILTSCGSKYKLELHSPKTIQVNKLLRINVTDKNGNSIDSIQYFLNGKRLDSPKSVDINNYVLGKQAISAIAYFQGEQKELNNTIYFLAANPPIVYSYKIINEYPHDSKAFTQGFEYHNGFLYESTGQRGKSTLRKVELKTGKVLQKINIDKKYFAEGMTIFNNKIYQLTWQGNVGFVYNLESFELEKTFNYNKSKEGWGLTHDNKRLIKTDGTERIWFLNPETLKEESFIEAYTNSRKAEKLNELEFIEGKIYANLWQQNSILIVNPKNGAIEGIVNLKGLQSKVGKEGNDKVLNGIAYDAENNRLFVTGKEWNKVFEIELVKK